MVERSQPLPTLADPPRDIPLGLLLKILAPYDVTVSANPPGAPA